MSEWQIIDTAPEDKEVLVWNGKYIRSAIYHIDRWNSVDFAEYYYDITHWMPLPEPPEKDLHEENLEMLINIYKNQKSVLNDIEIDESIKNTVREISEQHRKILDDWAKAYLAELYEEGVEIKPGCFTLVEQDASFKSGIYQKKYWFEKSDPRKHHCTFDYADVEIIEQDGVLKMFVDGLTIPVKYCPLCGES